MTGLFVYFNSFTYFYICTPFAPRSIRSKINWLVTNIALSSDDVDSFRRIACFDEVAQEVASGNITKYYYYYNTVTEVFLPIPI